MKIKVENKVTVLSDTLKEFFGDKMNLARIKFFGLFISALCKVFHMLPKFGNSSTSERIDLINPFFTLFGSDNIDCPPYEPSWACLWSLQISVFHRPSNNCSVLLSLPACYIMVPVTGTKL